jgi:hypothetical protein
MTLFLRLIVACGFFLDAGVGLIALVLPQQLEPWLDIPYRDNPALATFGGGEFIVVAAVYVLLFLEPRRRAFLFWILALDQTFATILPALEIARGHIPASIKTIGPIPFVAALAIVYVWAALRFSKGDPNTARSSSRGT